MSRWPFADSGVSNQFTDDFRQKLNMFVCNEEIRREALQWIWQVCACIELCIEFEFDLSTIRHVASSGVAVRQAAAASAVADTRCAQQIRRAERESSVSLSSSSRHLQGLIEFRLDNRRPHTPPNVPSKQAPDREMVWSRSQAPR